MGSFIPAIIAETSTPSSSRTNGHNVASMAWGPDLWFPHRSKKAKQTAWGVFIAIIVIIIVGILICICACCVCCPGCPAYRYGPKDAVAAAVSPAAQPQVAQPPGGEDPGQKGPLGTLPAP